MATLWSVIVSEAPDIQQFVTGGAKILQAFPQQPTLISLLAFWRAEQADIVAEEALAEKIYNAFAGLVPTPTPGPLKALAAGCDVEAELKAVGANGQILSWLVANFPQILADIEQLIALFGKKG